MARMVISPLKNRPIAQSGNMNKSNNISLSVTGFSKPLSTGRSSAVLLMHGKLGAPAHPGYSSVGAWLNLEKIARRRKKSFIKTIDKISGGIEYRPQKKKMIRLSIKALIRPRTFVKTLPRPITQEGMRVLKGKRV